VSNICVPHAFTKKPYRMGILVVLVFMAAHFTVNVSLFVVGRLENGRRNRQASDTETELGTTGSVQDETDKRNPRFRYAF
jgi:hypothetical protein